jgi:hypothetical protein
MYLPLMLYLQGEQHPECTPLPLLTLDLNPSLMGFDDLFAMEEAHARTLCFLLF